MATQVKNLTDLTFGVAANGTITIKNAGTVISTISAGTYRKWYTYYSGTDLYFVDQDSSAPGGSLRDDSYKNDANLTITFGQTGSDITITAAGDLRPDGTLTLPVDVQNPNSSSITKYAIIKCTGTPSPQPTFSVYFP